MIDAQGDVDLLASRSTQEQHSASSSSAAVGLSIGSQTGITLSASAARGNADGSDVNYTNTHINTRGTAAIKSGGNTTLQGAVVSGRQVFTDIKGDLLVESLQDTSTFDSKNRSLGGSVTIGPTGPTGGSISASRSNVNADYASVDERSGIQAGDGGFQVGVAGNTALVGGVIASTLAAVDGGKNSFDASRLTTTDIQNRDNFDASGFSISGGYSASGKGASSDGSKQDSASGNGAVPNQAGGVNGAAAGFGSASGHRSSTTTSGVSGLAGNTDVRTNDASTGLARTFDAAAVSRDIAAQVQITSTFGQQAGAAVGDYATAKYNELKDSDPAEAAKWAEGGAYRIAAHAIAAGLTGGLRGALGAATSQLAIDEIAKQIAATELPLAVKTALVAAAGTAIGAAVGGEAGAIGGFNATTNNYLSTADLASKAQAMAACNGNASCIATLQRASQATSLANNAKVLDACQTEGGDCAAAIKQAEKDRDWLKSYRAALEDELSRAPDAAGRDAIATSIREADRQIASANNAIVEGKLIEAGGDYTAAGLTAEERTAIGFALDPLEAAGIKTGGKSSTNQITPIEGLASTSESQAGSVNGLRLSKQLASQEQISELIAGKGTPVAGAQGNVPLRDAPRLAAQYGGDAKDWIKVTSSSYVAKDGSMFGAHAYRNTVTGKLVEPKTIAIHEYY